MQAHFSTDFNPRTPCGVRQRSASTCPRRRSFQSTHPLRGATYGVGNGNYPNAISIHAPLAGCDRLRRLRDLELVNFNPRTPCGVRLPVERPSQLSILFQSTHPLRGATWLTHTTDLLTQFQSTHPLRGATFRNIISTGYITDFNPRTPCGVRLQYLSDVLGLNLFQSTHPLRGATSQLNWQWQSYMISIHAPLAGCDLHPH